MVSGARVRQALAGPGAPLPPRVGRAVARMAVGLSAEARPLAVPKAPPLRTLVLGMPGWRTLTGLETVLGPADVVTEPRGAAAPEVAVPPGGFDVGVALRWLAGLEDPDAGLAALREVAPRHLLLAGPREPFDPLRVRLPARRRGGTRWFGTDFLRLVSRHGAIRDVAHPVGFTLVWLHPS